MFDITYVGYFIVLLWVPRTVKAVLFWMYLWQLKDYHVGRFIDHFRTTKGKKLLFDPLILVKIVLLPLLFLNSLFLYVLLGIYVAETVLFIFQITRKNIKKPVFTLKVIIIALICITGVIFYSCISTTANLLVFDILTPIIISGIILLFQPFFVLARNNILAKARKKMVSFPDLTVIAITGSYGKTSTKEFLATILSAKYKVLATPEHKNSEIGIAQTILSSLNEKHQIFIVEMGAYNKGGITLLCNIVSPSIGIVTGVNEQHLATFGSLENLLSAEGGGELAADLPRKGLLVVNGDNIHCLDLYKKTDRELEKKIYTVQKNKVNSDIWTEDATATKENISFIVNSKQKEMAHITANVLGKQNIQNLLAAILVAHHLDMSFEQIASACQNIAPNQAGMLLKRGIHGIDVVDSSYSANPDGVMADLDYLQIFTGKKVIVMPCLIELGAASAKTHERIGRKIAQVCDLAIITTKDAFKEIKAGAMVLGMKEEYILLCDGSAGSPQTNEILHHITTFCKEGDAVLLEGRVPGELIKLLNDK